MPTYQYACTNPACGNRFELVQTFTDPAVSECPVCGESVRKVFSPVGVVFKGSGFYRNDSRSEAGKAKVPAGAKSDPSGKSESGAGSESSGAKSDTGGKSDTGSKGDSGGKSESKSTDSSSTSANGSSPNGASSGSSSGSKAATPA